MNRTKAYSITANILNTVIAVYALTMAYYSVFGPFDYSIMGVRIYLRDTSKPYQILMFAAMLRAALYVFYGSGIIAGAKLRLLDALTLLAGRPHAVAIGLILSYAMGLRLWSLAQGSQDEVFYDDALDFIRMTWIYLNGDYLRDTGYPDFSSHMTEFGVRFMRASTAFLGFLPFELSRTVINLCAVTLNLVYTLGTMAAVYGIAGIIGRRDAGILALFLMGVSITELQTAHYYINDVPMSFLAMLGVYCFSLNLKEEKPLFYILSGVFMALAFASKFNAALSFIYIGFIYLRLHPSPGDFVRHLGGPLKLSLIFVIVYILVNPLFLIDPAAKIDYTIEQIYYMTRPRGQGGFTPEENTLLNHIKVLFSHRDYHLWAIRGLLDPVPLSLGLAAIGYVAYRHGWTMAFLWLSPFIFVLAGRLTKPNSAPLHYLNLIPLLLLAVSVGMMDFLYTLRSATVRVALLGSLVLWGGYQALQDTSYWSLTPSFKVQHDWLKENVNYYANVSGPKDLMPLAVGDPRKIREVYTGPEKWCYALHRDERHYIILNAGLPTLLPKTHFPSQRKETTIFPASVDLAVTDRLFATGPEPRLYEVTRRIMAGEAGRNIAVTVKNAALKENLVTLKIGSAKFKKKLGPGETAFFEAPVEGNRTFLMEGRYVELFVNSEEDAVWLVAATDESAGDLRLEHGDKAGALADYSRSGTAYSLLRVMALADEKTKKLAAASELKRKYPELYRTMTTVDPAQWTFLNLAGWDENIFMALMTRIYGYDEFHKQEIPPLGFTLSPGANMWGPYLPIMKGNYRLDVKWLVNGAGPESFNMNYSTRRIPGNSIGRVIPGSEAAAGRTSASFTQENVVDFPFEVWIGGVRGGDLGVAEVALTIDYFTPMKKTVMDAVDAVGLETLKGL